MKNRLLYLLLASLFVLGNTAFNFEAKGGVIIDIVTGKNGTLALSLSVPEEYLTKSGELVIPIEITISQNGKKPVFSAQSGNLQISLPCGLSGTYLLEIRIGAHYFFQQLQL